MSDRKERSGCRKAIFKLQIYPYVEDGVWDGETICKGTDPNPSGSMSEGLKRQMRKMAEEGVWGPMKVDRKLWYDGKRYIPSPW